MHASLAWLPMVEEKSVHAPHAVIVKVLHDRNSQFKGKSVDLGRHGGKDIVNKPELVVSEGLIITELLGDSPVGAGLEGGDSCTEYPTGKGFRAGSQQISDIKVTV
jgi:hypothetical protein